MASRVGDISIANARDYVETALLQGWSKTPRRMRAVAYVLICFLCFTTFYHLVLKSSILSNIPPIPALSLEHGPQPESPYNASKVALLIESRATPNLAPIMLQFISVVPQDWRFRFMGSKESVTHMNSSWAVRSHVDSSKLELTYIPKNMKITSREDISQFLTNLWLYETVLYPAEWLLIFQIDSVLCANSRQSLNNWLEYDWVGAPWQPDARFGGNGGLSLRRVSKIVEVLRNQQRIPNSEAEDIWLTDRLSHLPGAKLANGTTSLMFSGEIWEGQPEVVSSKTKTDLSKAGDLIRGIDDWRNGFYEPMGYHIGSGTTVLQSSIWETPEKRKHIWDYCPEVKMILKMDAAKFVPGECNIHWRRSDDGSELATEIIDGEGYPILSPALSPW